MKIIEKHNTIREAYTLITEGTDEDNRPCFNVWLQVDQQQFCTTPQPYDTREEAEWFREQLATALLRVVREQQEQPTKKGKAA